MIRRSTSSYPTAAFSGDQVYFDTGTAWSDTGLTPGTHYYYSALSWVEGSDVWSATYVTDDTTTTTLVLPTVTSSAATSVEETTATGHGDITSTGEENCDYRGFVWGTTSHSDPGNIAPASSGYDSNWTENGSYGTGTFNHGITSLTEGIKYYFRACAHNSAGWSYGVEQSFLSSPDPPASFSATKVDTGRIDLSWTKGAGAEKTKIQRKEGSYPVDRNDGTQVYFEAGTAVSDTGLTANTTYYYCAWSYIEGSEQWSDTYAQASAGTFSGYDIDLSAGWNLVSLPLIPISNNITDIISDANLASGDAGNLDPIYCYETASASWKYRINGSGTITTMEDGLGYWVYATVADTLTIHGSEAAHPGPDYPVLADWNMIGFTSTTGMALETYLASVAGNYDTVYRWNAATGTWSYWMTTSYNFDTMNPGYGYWLHMTTGGTITPP